MTLAYENPKVTDPAEVERRFAHYRPRILLWSIIGYAMFYFVRKNLSIAMPVMEKQLGITKSQLGLFLTLHGILYGLSKFGNGFVGDRVNARYFMAIGLFFSAIMNIFFGLSSAVVTLGSFWVANALFQGMGFPPCARLITHWFSPKELATKMSLWNTSHGIGAAAVLVLCGYLVAKTNDWRMCFFVPAGLAIATTGLLLIYLRDTPESVGLPPIAGTGPDETGEARGFSPKSEQVDERSFTHLVFKNPYIWIFCLANFFVYTIRYAVLDWSPTMLKEFKGISLAHGGWMTAGFELAGAVGAVCAGWITDRFFDGKPARMSVFCMIFCGMALYIFWKTPGGNLIGNAVLLMIAGFFVYGPQALIGVAAANLATKRAAATAVGLTGIFGYASGVLSGWGLGALVEARGWNGAFIALFAAAALATITFIIAWGAPRDGYAKSIDEPDIAARGVADQ